MDKSLKINPPNFSHRLFAFLLDITSTSIATLILYFVILYAIYIPFFGYSQKKNIIDQYETSYNLRMAYGESYDKYEDVCKKFYLSDFKEDILKDYNKDNLNYSIVHIYNINVLNLPNNPTPSNYSTSYFHYVVNSDGSYDVDSLGVQINGSGDRYEKDLSDLFYTSYEELPIIMRKYVSEYNNAFIENSRYQDEIRLISLGISITIFYLILPLSFKYSETLFEKLFNIGFVDSKNGYKINKIFIFIRPIIYFLLPAIGLYLFTKYSIAILIILPIFIDIMVMILSINKKDLYEKICHVECCDILSSSIYKNEMEENKHEMDTTITDQGFLDALNSVASNDKNIKK